MAAKRLYPTASLLGLTVTVTLMLGTSSALAAPQDGAGARLAAAGDGARVPACSACHGTKGQGMSAMGTPRLAGLDPVYFTRQIADFAAGTRANATMAPIARALSADQIRALALYYGSLPKAAPLLVGLAPTKLRRAPGAELAERGAWARGVPACAACHGMDGRGVGANFPPLAGQNAAYLANQLQAFKSGTRAGDPQGLMRGIAARLTEAEIAAAAGYYAPGQAAEAAPPPAAPAAATKPAARSAFAPPPESAIPNDPFGKLVREGEAVFRDTGHYAHAFVGNRLACANCHLDAGRLANSAPLWAAYVAYPAYRKKNRRVNSYAERLQGCFRFSMNGHAPPLGSNVLAALEAYSYFLAKGAPTGVSLPGRGYPRLAPPPEKPDYARGATLYKQKCAFCHGPDGAGQAADGRTVFPPLWGAQSYNWGAGMASVNMAAAFIKANMPLSQAESLSDQQAWDLAAFLDSHERPQDPRFTGSIRETRARFHDTPMSMYGERVQGHLLGQGTEKPAASQ